MLLRECRNAPLSQYPLHKLTFLWTYTLKTIRYYKNTRNIYSTSIKPPSTTEKCVSHDLNRYPAQTFVANCFIFITVVLGDTLIFQAQASQVCLHVLSYVGHSSLKHLSWKEQDFFSSSWRGFTSHLWCFFGSKNWWSPRYFRRSASKYSYFGQWQQFERRPSISTVSHHHQIEAYDTKYSPPISHSLDIPLQAFQSPLKPWTRWP